MSSESLALVAGVLLSLLFSYVPGLKDWFDKLSGNHKRLVMLGALLVSALGVFGLSCTGRYNFVACETDGAWALIEVFVLAAVANQAAYGFTPEQKGESNYMG